MRVVGWDAIVVDNDFDRQNSENLMETTTGLALVSCHFSCTPY